MEAFLKILLLGSHGLLAYAGIFSILVACGLGVPLPEDISLILGGFLAHQGAVDLAYMIVVGFVGILVGDSLIFFAGRRLGTQALNRFGFLSRIVTPCKRSQVERLFVKHGEKIVMLARFLPGVRAVTYFTAGSAGMSYARFLVFDGIAAMASAPLFVLLGFRFGGELEVLVGKVKQCQVGLLGFLAVGLVVTWVIRKRRTLALARNAAATGTGAMLMTLAEERERLAGRAGHPFAAEVSAVSAGLKVAE